MHSSSSSTFRSEVFEPHRERVYRLAYDLTGSKEDAEDLTQDVFLSAYEKWDTFRGESELYTWLYRITMNTYLDQPDQRGSWMQSLWDQVTGRGQDVADKQSALPDEEITRSTVEAELERALQRLTARERAAFALRFRQECTAAQAAEVMGVAEGTVKSLTYRAVRKLRKTLSSVHESTSDETS